MGACDVVQFVRTLPTYILIYTYIYARQVKNDVVVSYMRMYCTVQTPWMSSELDGFAVRVAYWDSTVSWKCSWWKSITSVYAWRQEGAAMDRSMEGSRSDHGHSDLFADPWPLHAFCRLRWHGNVVPLRVCHYVTSLSVCMRALACSFASHVWSFVHTDRASRVHARQDSAKIGSVTKSSKSSFWSKEFWNSIMIQGDNSFGYRGIVRGIHLTFPLNPEVPDPKFLPKPMPFAPK